MNNTTFGEITLRAKVLFSRLGAPDKSGKHVRVEVRTIEQYGPSPFLAARPWIEMLDKLYGVTKHE